MVPLFGAVQCCCLLFFVLTWNNPLRHANAFSVVRSSRSRILSPAIAIPPISPIQTATKRLAANEKRDVIEGDEMMDEEVESIAVEEEEEESAEEKFGFNPDNFDQSALPVPLFTGLVVMAVNLYVIGYFLYVGLNGFPENDKFPRPF